MREFNKQQRDDFESIARLAFVNPFSQERLQADEEFIEKRCVGLPLKQRIDQVQKKLVWQLRDSGALQNFCISAVDEKSRDTMVTVWLFYQFHEFEQDFARLIEQQQQAGEKNLRVSFADKIVSCFEQAGFSDQDTEKYIALFWQLHRGFTFINQHIAGECLSMTALRMRLWNNIFTFNPRWYLEYLNTKMEDFSTLLLGETGTGKSLAAYTIGRSGFIPYSIVQRQFLESFTRSYQSINLAQFPATLLESELFGHKKGAFTGAIEKHEGVFARCSAHGAVFIDEIGDIDIPTQVKLLNVIQDRWFCPIGSHEKKRFSGRVIAATNRDIEALREQHKFRDDLYYRLCSDVIEIPGLQQRIRENPTELRGLVASLIRRVIDAPDEALLDQLEQQIHSSVPIDYAWPGNVRELEQCLRQICLTGRYRPQLRRGTHDSEVVFGVTENKGEITATQLMQQYCQFLYERYGRYESVARITHLDRRTVKKYIHASSAK